MLQRFITAVYNVLRKIYGISGARHLPFVHSFMRLSIDSILNLLALRKGITLPNYKHIGCDSKLRFIFGLLDTEIIGLCKSLVHLGMNVLDIGAHCGYYSRLFSELVGPDGIVYAFEPHPENYWMLRRNIVSLRYQNVQIARKAVTNRIGKSEFIEMTGSSSWHSLYDVSKYLPDHIPGEKYIVETTTVDAFLAEEGNPEIGFIKMDIEGAEPVALEGMSQTITKSKNLVMTVEFNPGALQAGGVKPEEFLRQLDTMGFKVQVIEPDGRLTPIHQLVYPDGPSDWYVNLLCRKDTAI